MKLRCPECGAGISLDQAEKAGDLAAVDKAAALFGADFDLVREYLDCFRSGPGVPLALKKRLRLLREVWGMWSSEQFEFGGLLYPVKRAEFREVLAQMGNRDLTGLKNHNYLKQILKAAARATSLRQEREFKEREGRLRGGGSPSPQPSPPRGKGVIAVGEVLGEVLGPSEDPGWRAEFSRLNQLIMRARNQPEEKGRLQRKMDEHLKNRK